MAKNKLRKRLKKRKNVEFRDSSLKKPLSAYFIFAKERREVFKATQPELDIMEISKVIGIEWKGLTEDEKEEYKRRSLEDKSRYENEKIALMIKKKKTSKVIVVESSDSESG